MNYEAREIATDLQLDHLMEGISKAQAYPLVKDHKKDWPSVVSVRLINPSKSDMGKVSKHILQRIVKTVKSRTGAKLWQDSKETITWFKQLKNKDKLTFLQFDIVSYYPTINEKLLRNALSYAEKYCSIDDQEKQIFMNCRRTFLFHKGCTFIKKGADLNNNGPPTGHFDVPMGANDSCEICECVGLYLLDQISGVFKEGHYGLYRDDGLAVSSAPADAQDKMRQELEKIFKKNDMKIETIVHKKAVEFLDIKMCLETGTTRPYKKPTDTLSYVHTSSNHPISVIRSVPKTVETRLSMLSSTREIFEEEEKIPYEEALKMSGHQVSLKYQPQEQEVTRKKRARKKKVIYFCPPYSKDVKTNIGARFLKLIDKHFPKGSELSKIINRNSMKVGYSCLRNMKKHIDIHNRKLLSKHWNKDAQDKRSCNCRKPEDCPVEGKCLEESVVYEADVLSKHGTMSYYGMTARPFKTRYTEHKQSLPSQTSKMCPLDRKRRYEHKSELSAYCWKLWSEDTSYTIKWKIHSKAYAYRNGARRCDLCLQEKLVIGLSNPKTTLNSRNELASKCRHKWKFSLAHCAG